MARAKKQTTKAKPASQTKPAAAPASDPKQAGGGLIDDIDALNTHLSRARGVVDAVRGAYYGELLDPEDAAHALESAFEHLEQAKEAVSRLNKRRHQTAQPVPSGAV